MKQSLAIMAMGLLLIPAIAAAQPGGSVELVSQAEVEVPQQNDKGESALKRIEVDKANVLPGDTVIYTITYTNRGEKPATNVVINNPVPEHMLYVDKSAEGVGTRIVFSIDNGKTYGPAAALKITDSAGKERPARADDITNVKWTLEKPLQPGTSGSVSYRARVK